MDMSSDRIGDLMQDPRFHFFEGDITINRSGSSTTSASAT